MSESSVWKIALPMATLTAVGMLATDLYLPAVPGLPEKLNGTIVQAQWTLASFLASLAISQILWGWASDRYGESGVIKLGMYFLLGGSVMCALSSDFFVLILGRTIQGLGAGSATAAVPAPKASWMVPLSNASSSSVRETGRSSVGIFISLANCNKESRVIPSRIESLNGGVTSVLFNTKNAFIIPDSSMYSCSHASVHRTWS